MKLTPCFGVDVTKITYHPSLNLSKKFNSNDTSCVNPTESTNLNLSGPSNFLKKHWLCRAWIWQLGWRKNKAKKTLKNKDQKSNNINQLKFVYLTSEGLENHFIIFITWYCSLWSWLPPWSFFNEYTTHGLWEFIAATTALATPSVVCVKNKAPQLQLQ